MAIPSFKEISGHATSFRWQEELYANLVEGCCPARIDLPTGTGKTSVMALWLLALAEQARRGSHLVTLARRLVWVVDRRVVVDQATDEAEQIRCRLNDPALRETREALASLSASGEPLAISTLRGEHADNREWFDDPTRPAIIVGTVDMIGSRLLFSGYGVGMKERARQAGLLAHDALIVNDEAHLTPVFGKLLDEACREAKAGKGVRPSVRFVRLSATQRDKADGEAFPKNLDDDVAASEVFRNRYYAQKRLEIERSESVEKLAVESKGRTIVFVRSPQKARAIAAAIRKTHKLDDGDIPLVTGEQRGLERDALVDSLAFKRFTPGAERDGDCWLVATSAGEVGVNISCDRLITELDTADHLLQRFGRLNRFGETEGVATVVVGKKHDEAELATLTYLEKLGGDVSPRALRERPPGPECLSPEPKRAPLQPWLTDVWSMTSLPEKAWPSRPKVEPWLHGDDTGSAPETYVCWRRDVTDLARGTVSSADREEVFRWFPVLAEERLKQYPDTLCEALEKHFDKDLWVLLIGRDRTITPLTVSKLVARAERANLHYATVVLPPGVGKLDANGAVDWSKSVNEEDPDWKRYDVSGKEEGVRRRIKRGPGEPDLEGDELKLRHEVRLASDVESEKAPSWRYYTEKKRAQKGSKQGLAEHQAEVRRRAEEIARKLLGAEDRLVQVLRWAADRHDLGKDCEVWQRYAGNSNGTKPLGKFERPSSPALLAGYRHELGSLLDPKSADREDLTEEEHELALHLIASHHGRARPCFPASAMDKRQVRRSQEEALRAAHRFARLQRRHGAWGLVYLEALFCAADAMASRESPEDPDHA